LDFECYIGIKGYSSISFHHSNPLILDSRASAVLCLFISLCVQSPSM